MSFLHSILLGGLALGLLPILIHLLTRRRHKVVRWGAMKYLLQAIEETSKRVQIEDLILLALRVLIICLLALAVARPFLKREATRPGAQFAVLLVDNSPSMQAVRGGASRWDQARAWAREMLAALPPGSRVAVLPLCNPSDPAALREPTRQTLLAADVIDQFPASALSADPTSALNIATDLVAGSDLPTRAVYILSDFQANDWRDPGGRVADAMQSLLRNEGTSIIAVSCGGDVEEPVVNAAVTRLDRSWRVIKIGRDIQINAELARFATGPAASGNLPDVATTLQIDGVKADARSAPVQADQPRRVDYFARFDAAGDHEVILQSASDPSPADNVRYLALQAREEVRVLIVDGDRHIDAPVQSESFYLRFALAEGQSEAVPITADIVETEEFNLRPTAIDRYDVVVLANVSQVAPIAARELTAYVRAGRAAVIFLGDLVDTQSYNSELFRDGKEALMRAHLGRAIDAPRDNATGRPDAFHLAVGEFRGPVTTFFTGDDLADLDKAAFDRALEIDLNGAAERDGVRVDARLDNGLPLLITRPVGEGRLAVFNTTADIAWSNLAINPGFTPLMQRLMVWLLEPSATSRNLVPGETWELSLPLATMDTTVTVATPDGRTLPLEATADTDRQRAIRRFSDTTQPGFYRVSWLPSTPGGQPQGRLFSVNIPPSEADLTAVDGQFLREQAGPSAPAVLWMSVDSEAAGKPGELFSGRELWWGVLVAALVLLAIEQYLARRFSGGTR